MPSPLRPAAARLHYAGQNLHPPRLVGASKPLAPSVSEMAPPLRLLARDYARAGCTHEKIAAGEPANDGPRLGLCDPSRTHLNLVDSMLPADRGSGVEWDRQP